MSPVAMTFIDPERETRQASIAPATFYSQVLYATDWASRTLLLVEKTYSKRTNNIFMLNPLPDDKILGLPTLKAFEDDN